MDLLALGAIANSCLRTIAVLGAAAVDAAPERKAEE